VAVDGRGSPSASVVVLLHFEYLMKMHRSKLSYSLPQKR
jgi:hypothetical protein